MKALKKYEWTIIGAGPAGMVTLGVLLDNGVEASDILWIDPSFKVGDFGEKWGEVSSNTSVELFFRFMEDIKSFNYEENNQKFAIDSFDRQGFTLLKEVAKPLQWVTNDLLKRVDYSKDMVTDLKISDGAWNLCGEHGKYISKKIVLATGALPKSLNIHNFEVTKEVDLSIALTPNKLKQELESDDKVAVFGSSHSAMIIIKNLLESGVKEVANFYLEPLKYAVNMGDYILYDNSGLKGETAKWVRKNISQNLDSRIKRYLSTDEQVNKHLHKYNKIVYATGFQQRVPSAEGIDVRRYDPTTGIIAPGLFGVGIGFPQKVTDPNGNVELNVGLFKFMKDIKRMLPLWEKYDI